MQHVCYRVNWCQGCIYCQLHTTFGEYPLISVMGKSAFSFFEEPLKISIELPVPRNSCRNEHPAASLTSKNWAMVPPILRGMYFWTFQFVHARAMDPLCFPSQSSFDISNRSLKSNGSLFSSGCYKENHRISHPLFPPVRGTAPRGGAGAPGRKAWRKMGHWSERCQVERSRMACRLRWLRWLRWSNGTTFAICTRVIQL